MPRVPVLLVALGAVALAGCGGSGDSGSTTKATTAPRPQPKVTLTAPTHQPVVGAPWPIAITARDPAGHPLRAEVRYQYLFGGSVVARRSHYRFHGVFHDTIRWPARSLGVPLTFRAVVTTPLGTRRLDYDVRVKRGAR